MRNDNVKDGNCGVGTGMSTMSVTLMPSKAKWLDWDSDLDVRCQTANGIGTSFILLIDAVGSHAISRRPPFLRFAINSSPVITMFLRSKLVVTSVWHLN